MISMKGLVADSRIALTTLKTVSLEINSMRLSNEQITTNEQSTKLHEVLCVAMETKFQYISFQNANQVAVLDVNIIDSSLITAGTVQLGLILPSPMSCILQV